MTSRLPLAAALLIALVFGAGCSGDSDDPPAPVTSESPGGAASVPAGPLCAVLDLGAAAAVTGGQPRIADERKAGDPSPDKPGEVLAGPSCKLTWGRSEISFSVAPAESGEPAFRAAVEISRAAAPGQCDTVASGASGNRPSLSYTCAVPGGTFASEYDVLVGPWSIACATRGIRNRSESLTIASDLCVRMIESLTA